MRVLVALGVSAVVHLGLVLWAAQRPEPEPRVVAPEPGTPFEVFEAAAPPPPAPVAPPPVKAAAKPTATALPVVQETSPVEVAGVAEAVAAPAEAEPAPAVAAAAVAPAPAPAPVVPTRTFDVTALHAALAESARRCYPAAARRYRLAGEATVAFCLDAAGNLTSTKLASSTGESLLDDAARDCVVAGALPLPAAAAGGCYQVPVRFGAR